MQGLPLFLRSTIWTLLFPGFFAGFVPWMYFGLSEVEFSWTNPWHLVGGLLVVLGIALLITCIVEFGRSGKGTLSPVDPPRELVVQGLYRYVRNPMYLSVSTIILGEALLTKSMALFIYWVIWFFIANLFVMVYEERRLHRQFGASYETYARNVGRWLPKFTVDRG